MNGKSMLIIGIGRFGKHLCQKLAELGNQIMIVDEKEENLEDLLPYVVSAKIGDCTNPSVLESLGVGDFDICFVCIGTNFQSSLEITSQLKEMGAKYVISKASRDIQAKFLLRNGADEIIYPERDVAERLAVRCSANHVYDFMELTDDYAIYEISPLPEWVGKTLAESRIRNNYDISILGTKKGDQTVLLPKADTVIKEDEHLLAVGSAKDMDKLLKQLK